MKKSTAPRLAVPVSSIVLRFSLAFLVLAVAATGSTLAGPLGLKLATDNDAIFSNDPSKFYMYTDRNFEGVRSKPWSGGQFGFVRNQKRTSSGVVFTRFHEGVDIRPVKRDSSGVPLDDVRAIADGKVAYVNAVSGRSSYGKYVVIEHNWGSGPFYSLSAHLNSVTVKAGQPVKGGQIIGRLGYTGAGINRERSHVHLELNMLLSTRFGTWHKRHFRSANYHGIHNGINLEGVDIAGLFHSHRANPNITMPEFIRSTGAYYTVAVPKGGKLAILERYPWLGRDLDKAVGASAWEITLNSSGLPMEVKPSSRKVKYPAVVSVRSSKTDHSYHTRGRITGTGERASLTASGSRYIQLLTGAF